MYQLKQTFLKTLIFVFAFFQFSSARAALPAVVDGESIPTLAPMLEQITPAVVNIATEGKVQIQQNPLFNDPFFRRFFDVPDQPLERKTQSLGSGVIVDAERGLIITNNHVIANALQITVTLRDGKQLDAEIVGTDPETDVAVIKVQSENLTDIELADSDELRVGDFVVAIGNPFGLGQTVTSGIVSALGRSGLGIEGYEDFIQTDASINPGNSGGALVNLRGELIGINTAIFSRSGGNIGIGFAIPMNVALNIMEQLVENGEVERGFLGVHMQDLSPELAEAFGLERQQGAVINRVMEDSPAAKAGFEPGDVVISLDGKSIRNASDVRHRIGLLPVGEKVRFEILREGERIMVTAAVSKNENKGTANNLRNKRLSGVTVGNIEKDNPYYGRVQGLFVAAVERGTPAWVSGLREGDVITSVNRRKVNDLEQFKAIVNNLKEPLLIRIVRQNTAMFIVIN